MKTTKLLMIAIAIILFSSCMPKFYYQVYKATPVNASLTTDNALIFEDNNCKVSYNFWDKGGDAGFSFYNKTDNNIYINKEECFFILNGIAYDYFKNRVYTSSTNVGSNTGAVTSQNFSYSQSVSVIGNTMVGSGYSVSFTEEKVICIPPHSSKIISEYNINESLYRNCDLYLYPSKRQIKAKEFTKSDSPFIFSNRISYILGKTGNTVVLVNDFFVSEITNYPEKELTEWKFDEFCGKRSMVLTKYVKNVSPDKFYIYYMDKNDDWGGH